MFNFGIRGGCMAALKIISWSAVMMLENLIKWLDEAVAEFEAIKPVKVDAGKFKDALIGLKVTLKMIREGGVMV